MPAEQLNQRMFLLKKYTISNSPWHLYLVKNFILLSIPLSIQISLVLLLTPVHRHACLLFTLQLPFASPIVYHYHLTFYLDFFQYLGMVVVSFFFTSTAFRSSRSPFSRFGVYLYSPSNPNRSYIYKSTCCLSYQPSGTWINFNTCSREGNDSGWCLIVR